MSNFLLMVGEILMVLVCGFGLSISYQVTDQRKKKKNDEVDT
ncbi:MAG: hypothetical protein AAFV93_23000 [Chloroflexota bacterium]